MSQRRRAPARAAATRPTARPSSAPRGQTARRPAARRPAAARSRRRQQARTEPSGLRRAAGGDRPFLAALIVLVIAATAMALGPVQNYTAAADRVEALASTREQLSAQVDRLEDRRTTLEDPEELELIARTELGLVRPGEIPFVVVGPEGPEEEQVRPPPGVPDTDQGGHWFRRLGRAVGRLFDTAG